MALVGLPRAERIAPILGMVLGLTPDADDSSGIAALSAESRQQAVIDAVAALLSGLADRGPVALTVDDLHWSDAASLRLTEGLVAHLTGEIPVLMVFAMRPEQPVRGGLGPSRPDPRPAPPLRESGQPRLPRP